MHIHSTIAATLLLAGSALVQAQYDYSSGKTDMVMADSAKADSGYGDSSYGDSKAESKVDSKGASMDESKAESKDDSYDDDSSYGDDYTMSAEPTATAVAAGADSATADVAETEAAAPSSGMDGTKVHVVSVSNKEGDLVFSPADIKAAEGDVVQFQFWPKVALPELRPHRGPDRMLTRRLQNHSIVQSTFDEPCEPIAKNSNVTGFFTGFMPVAADDTTMPTYSIPINDTKPIWFYCSQGKHCQARMVGVINAYALPCLLRPLFLC